MLNWFPHTLNCLMPGDFDCVRCGNRRVKPIDGDAVFDGNWISNVYKNGSIYFRLNTTLLEKSSVGSFSCCLMLVNLYRGMKMALVNINQLVRLLPGLYKI